MRPAAGWFLPPTSRQVCNTVPDHAASPASCSAGAEKGISTAELLGYNAVLSLPFLAGMVFLSGEIWRVGEVWAAAVETNPLFPALLVACSVLGALLNYSLFLCTVYNSALTTTIVGVLKGVAVTVAGFFFMGGVPFHILNVLGISMNTGGGVWYTWVKYKEKSRRQSTGPGVSLGKPLLPVSASMDPIHVASRSRTGSFGSSSELAGMLQPPASRG